MAIHKAAAALALGTAFGQAGFSRGVTFGLLTVFAVVAPIGIGIGMAIGDSSPLLDAVVLAFSGGTFLYVACAETVVREF